MLGDSPLRLVGCKGLEPNNSAIAYQHLTSHIHFTCSLPKFVLSGGLSSTLLFFVRIETRSRRTFGEGWGGVTSFRASSQPPSSL